MATYEVEHNIPPAAAGGDGPTSPNRPATPHHRPDLSAFLTTLSRFQEEQEQDDDEEDDPSHSTTTPATVLRELASSYSDLLPPPTNTNTTTSRPPGWRVDALVEVNENLRAMTEDLLRRVASRPSAAAIKGVPQEFLDGLERVRSRKALEAAGECPICGSVFAEDEFPLVVRLPCDRRHVFDLECVAGWLKVQRTCPLDRVDLIAREQNRREQIRREAMGGDDRKEQQEEEEEEWDGMFA